MALIEGYAGAGYRIGQRVQIRALAELAGLFLLGAVCALAIAAARHARWDLQPTDLDLTRALPLDYWVYLLIGTAAGICVLITARGEASITGCVVGLSALYGPCFLGGVYPAIAGWDSFLHAAPAQSLLQGMGIPATNYYAQQYPGAPLTLALLSSVMRVEPLLAGVLATMVIQVGLALIFMAIARPFVGLKAGAWTALAILALTPAIQTNDHYSPSLIGYLGLWGVVLMLTIYRHEQMQQSVLIRCYALLLAVCVIVAHPFLSLVAMGLVVVLAGWIWSERRNRSDVWWLTATLAVVIVVWISYVAKVYLQTGISSLRDVLFNTKDVVDSWTPLPVSEVLRRATPAVRALIAARLAIYAGTGGVALVGLLSRERRKRALILLALVVAASGSVLIGLASESPWLQRLTYFDPPLLTIGAALAIQQWVPRRRSNAAWQLAGGLVAVVGLLLGVQLWHPPSLFYNLHPQQASFVVWPQEIAAAAYISNAAPDRELVGSDLQTMIIHSYLEPNYPPFEHGVSMGSNLEKQLREQPLMFEGAWIIRSGRQELMSFQAQDLPPSFWAALDGRLAERAERIYDNGFVAIYHRR